MDTSRAGSGAYPIQPAALSFIYPAMILLVDLTRFTVGPWATQWAGMASTMAAVLAAGWWK
ncbi:hypothetical protein ABN448_08560 [Delftia acidovorans]|uniref:hypothetical protein n=1 Tax=Delftia acidovorans TaxID=80866 RepID=UPI0032DF6BD6